MAKKVSKKQIEVTLAETNQQAVTIVEAPVKQINVCKNGVYTLTNVNEIDDATLQSIFKSTKSSYEFHYNKSQRLMDVNDIVNAELATRKIAVEV